MPDGRMHAAFLSPYEVRDALELLAKDGVSQDDIEIIATPDCEMPR